MVLSGSSAIVLYADLSPPPSYNSYVFGRIKGTSFRLSDPSVPAFQPSDFYHNPALSRCSIPSTLLPSPSRFPSRRLAMPCLKSPPIVAVLSCLRRLPAPWIPRRLPCRWPSPLLRLWRLPAPWIPRRLPCRWPPPLLRLWLLPLAVLQSFRPQAGHLRLHPPCRSPSRHHPPGCPPSRLHPPCRSPSRLHPPGRPPRRLHPPWPLGGPRRLPSLGRACLRPGPCAPRSTPRSTTRTALSTASRAQTGPTASSRYSRSSATFPRSLSLAALSMSSGIRPIAA